MFVFYAIQRPDGKYFHNSSYGGRWADWPKLWKRKQDAQAVIKYRSTRSAAFIGARVIRLQAAAFPIIDFGEEA